MQTKRIVSPDSSAVYTWQAPVSSVKSDVCSSCHKKQYTINHYQ